MKSREGAVKRSSSAQADRRARLARQLPRLAARATPLVSAMLFAFGDNSSSQLGINVTKQKRLPAPERVVADAFKANLKAITAGDAHTAALDALGGVYVWGRTREGQCGKLKQEPVAVPTFLESMAHEHVTKIACGADTTFCLTASGSLYQLGAVHAPSAALAHADLAGYGRSLNDLSEANQAMLRASLASYLAAGDEQEEGEGEGEYGGDAADEAVVGTKRILQPEPTRVVLPDGERARAVAGGFGFTVVLKRVAVPPHTDSTTASNVVWAIG